MIYSDASLTATDVTEVMELVTADDTTKIWWQMTHGKLSLSSATNEKTQTLVDVLYGCEQMDAARKAKSFYRQYGKLQ